MPYKDPAKNAEKQRRYRARHLERVKERERLSSAARYTRTKVEEWDPMRDLAPENARRCGYRFHTTNPCRRKAQWISRTACRWCDLHAQAFTGLRRIED